jgi:DNA-binding MarR family transcriptional regulator
MWYHETVDTVNETTKTELSTNAKAVLDALRGHPSIGNIGLRLITGLSEPSYKAAIDELVRLGFIRWAPGRDRRIVLVDSGVFISTRKTTSMLPLTRRHEGPRRRSGE